MRRTYVRPTVDVATVMPSPVLGGSDAFLDEDALLGTLGGIERDMDAQEAATRRFFDLDN